MSTTSPLFARPRARAALILAPLVLAGLTLTACGDGGGKVKVGDTFDLEDDTITTQEIECDADECALVVSTSGAIDDLRQPVLTWKDDGEDEESRSLMNHRSKDNDPETGEETANYYSIGFDDADEADYITFQMRDYEKEVRVYAR